MVEARDACLRIYNLFCNLQLGFVAQMDWFDFPRDVERSEVVVFRVEGEHVNSCGELDGGSGWNVVAD